jgi:hypothetical protein
VPVGGRGERREKEEGRGEKRRGEKRKGGEMRRRRREKTEGGEKMTTRTTENDKRGGERQIQYSERRSELHCGYRNSNSNSNSNGSPLIDEDNIQVRLSFHRENRVL